MTSVRIAGGRVIDPSQNLDAVADLWISNGRIAGIGGDFSRRADRVVHAKGMLVVPGLVDMHIHLHDPGFEADETIASGTRAALEGGVTSVACMPDTEPAIDNQASAEFIGLQAKRADTINVWPVGAVTKGREGKELAEMGGLVQGGAVAFSDSDLPIANAEIMRRALEYAQMFNRPVLSHPEVPELTAGGLMNEGVVSMTLGLPGMPSAAEEIMVDRDLHLAQWTGGRLHIQNISCAGSVESVRRAKRAGVAVTCEVCPHHLALTDEELRRFDSNFKANPPLRTASDVAALIEGLRDETIDAIASGHTPRAPEQKMRELDAAPFGIIGVETLLAISVRTLIMPGHLTWPQLVARMATNPARVLGLDLGTLQVGRPADVTIIDPDAEWTVDPATFASKSRNCPFAGWKVRGRAHTVLVAGEVRFSCDKPTNER